MPDYEIKSMATVLTKKDTAFTNNIASQVAEEL